MTGAERRYVVVPKASGRKRPVPLGPFEYGEALDVQRRTRGTLRQLPTAERRPRVDAHLNPARRRAT